MGDWDLRRNGHRLHRRDRDSDISVFTLAHNLHDHDNDFHYQYFHYQYFHYQYFHYQW